MKIFTTLVLVLLVVIFLDILGFIAWNFSGQTPPDKFFIGMITNKLFNKSEDHFNGRNYTPYDLFDPETGEFIK